MSTENRKKKIFDREKLENDSQNFNSKGLFDVI